MPLRKDRLQRADGAGAQGAGARVAVESGHAEMLQRTGVEPGCAGQKALYVAVGKQAPSGLYDFAQMFNQGRCTPCRWWLLS